MKKRILDTNIQFTDLVLSGVSSSVAVYAAAASLASEKNGQFFVFIVMLGTLCSSLVVWFLGKSKVVLADATIYTLFALVAAFGIANLNDLAPDAVYTGPLTMAGVLSWMMALGSFTIWRDQTMLFQAVPGIALFGLVGCYDTFRASVVYFFAFLVCQATLLARAHARSMLRQARSSGLEALEISVMRKGPWRWMAGPEWALASALTIVLISAIGAPMLRESASSFSGLVRYTPPVSPLTQPSLANISINGTRVGTGPNRLSDAPVLRVQIPQPMYLRGFCYGRYDQGSWLPRTPVGDSFGGSAFQPTTNGDSKEVAFKIEPLEVFNTVVPVPGEVTELSNESANVYMRNAGGSYSVRGEPPFPPLEGRSVIFGGRIELKNADPSIGDVMPDYIERDGIPNDVWDFAQQATKGAKSDYEKAVDIKQAIENTVKYNINAGATPKDKDPVSYFLFTSKQGYCDLFASAMTLMARASGLPARFVTGYYPFQSDQDAEGRYIVREKDMHAWCEIYFKNAGWVTFDATEGADEVDGGGRGTSTDRSFWKSPWFLACAGLAGGASLGYGVFLFGGRYRRYRKTIDVAGLKANRQAQRTLKQVRRHYLAFEGDLRKVVRRPRGIGETIGEYVSAAAPKLENRSRLAAQVGAGFAEALYSPGSMNQDRIQELKESVKAFRQAKRGQPD